MCRSVGIPARYVEGYITPPAKDDDGVYIITNKQGHAWAEIYLEGYGWRQIEATPPEDLPRQLAALPLAENYPLTDEAGELRTIRHTEYIEHFGHLGYIGHSEDIERIELLSVNTDYNILHESNQSNENNFKFLSILQYDYQDNSLLDVFIFNLIIAVLLALVAFVLYILLRFFIERRIINKINGKENNEAAVEYYKIIVKYLRFFNYEKSPYETVFQFAERIRIDGISISMIKVSDILSKACYSNTQISSDDIIVIKRAINDLDDRMLDSIGRIKYCYYKYVKRIVCGGL
jgi:hypothetical protein